MEVDAGPEFDVTSFDISVRFLPLKLPDKTGSGIICTYFKTNIASVSKIKSLGCVTPIHG